MGQGAVGVSSGGLLWGSADEMGLTDHDQYDSVLEGGADAACGPFTGNFVNPVLSKTGAKDPMYSSESGKR